MEMMHGGPMGPMFSSWGMPWGMLGFFLIVAVILIALGVLRKWADQGHRVGLGDRKTGRTSLQDRIIQLALREGGRLTVTDVVAETGLPFKKVEKALNEMVGRSRRKNKRHKALPERKRRRRGKIRHKPRSRVNMRLDDYGVIVYEFAEIVGRDSGGEPPLQEREVKA